VGQVIGRTHIAQWRTEDGDVAGDVTTTTSDRIHWQHWRNTVAVKPVLVAQVCHSCSQHHQRTSFKTCIDKYQLSLIVPRDKIVLQRELDDLCDKQQWSSVGAPRYYLLSWPTTVQFITLWASTFLSWWHADDRYAVAKFSKSGV